MNVVVLAPNVFPGDLAEDSAARLFGSASTRIPLIHTLTARTDEKGAWGDIGLGFVAGMTVAPIKDSPNLTAFRFVTGGSGHPHRSEAAVSRSALEDFSRMDRAPLRIYASHDLRTPSTRI